MISFHLFIANWET